MLLKNYLSTPKMNLKEQVLLEAAVKGRSDEETALAVAVVVLNHAAAYALKYSTTKVGYEFERMAKELRE